MDRLKISSWQPAPGAPSYAVTRHLPLWEGAAAFALVRHEDPQVRQAVAEILANSVASSLSAKPQDAYAAFSHVLERANKQLAYVAQSQPLGGLDAFVGMFDGNSLHFSLVGSRISGLLVKEGKVTDICAGMQTDGHEFGYVSSGRLAPDEWAYVSHVDLTQAVADDDLEALTTVPQADRHAALLESLYEKAGVAECVETVIIRGQADAPAQGWREQAAWARGKAAELWDAAKADPRARKAAAWVRARVNLDARRVRAGLFGAGVVACAGLLYLTVSALLGSQASLMVPEEYKTKLIQARQLVDEAARAGADKAAAGKLLTEAGKLAFEVRDRSLYMKDVQLLQADISSLKKQLNGVQTSKADRANALWVSPEQGFSGVALVQVSGKPYLVGAEALVGPIIGGSQPKSYPYPDGAKAVSAGVTSNEKLYVLTDKGGVLEFAKETFSAAAADKGWAVSSQLATYDLNVYLLGADGSQVWRYRPSPKGGFGEKAPLLEKTSPKKLLSFAVDGGAYLLNQDLSLDKAFVTPAYSRINVRLNGLPDGYDSEDGKAPRIIASPDLNYVYLLMNGRVWVFDPGTKNYRAVTSLKYLGQIELAGAPADAVLVQRDGELLVANAQGVYAAKFDVVDGKVAVRND